MECPFCRSSNTVRPDAAIDQGSSSHLGLGASAGGAMVGVGFSKTREAKKARELRLREANENIGANESNAEKITQVAWALISALLYFVFFGLIGFRWEGYGDSFALSIFVLAIWLILPLILGYFVSDYFKSQLEEKGGFWTHVSKTSVEYWMCRSCGKTFRA